MGKLKVSESIPTPRHPINIFYATDYCAITLLSSPTVSKCYIRQFGITDEVEMWYHPARSAQEHDSNPVSVIPEYILRISCNPETPHIMRYA